jgi:hypothetical protein
VVARHACLNQITCDGFGPPQGKPPVGILVTCPVGMASQADENVGPAIATEPGGLLNLSKSIVFACGETSAEALSKKTIGEPSQSMMGGKSSALSQASNARQSSRIGAMRAIIERR